jgi:hypothetical protein
MRKRLRRPRAKCSIARVPQGSARVPRLGQVGYRGWRYAISRDVARHCRRDRAAPAPIGPPHSAESPGPSTGSPEGDQRITAPPWSRRLRGRGIAGIRAGTAVLLHLPAAAARADPLANEILLPTPALLCREAQLANRVAGLVHHRLRHSPVPQNVAPRSLSSAPAVVIASARARFNLWVT